MVVVLDHHEGYFVEMTISNGTGPIDRSIMIRSDPDVLSFVVSL
jgi:hypothetical protein